ncbi:Abi family protein [Aeromicrobium sp. PE09-221]|uniref:Abi family protein n=1 Tax=Aeromicrobium sp. PE09-221 TaxID=1898043 RepID=UPI00191C7874|nr:Abi family protein [Aeromicrobium sp. PE09-221]
MLDSGVAAHWLRAVGYYRLSGYWYPYRQFTPHMPEDRGDQFIPDTTFDEVVRLYEFDRKLRTLVHDGVERIEVALRSHVSYVVGETDPLAYQDAAHFRPTFDHGAWLSTVRGRVARARRHSEPIRHHESRYDGTLPIWVLTEVLDFSDVSRLYDGMLARDQWRIAEQLGVHVNDSLLSVNQRKKARKAHPLARWFEHLTVLRNTCAHHSRVWNRSFTPVSTAALRTIDGLDCLPHGQSERVFGALTVMGHLLQQTSPGTTWTMKVRSLIESTFTPLAGRAVAEMGFPRDWQHASLWAEQ